GITLLGREVDDAVRGRIFGFISTSARVVLMVTISAASLVAGFGTLRHIELDSFDFDLSFSRILLLVAAGIGVVTGILAFRNMDDKPGVRVLADLWSSMRGRPLT